MDRLTVFVAISHAKLRLEILQRHPEFLEAADMNPKFQGLASAMSKLNHNLDVGSDKLLSRIAGADARAGAAFAKVNAHIDATEQAAEDIEAFANSLEGSNGGGPLPDSSADSEPQPGPERLSVNGVAQG